MWPSSEDILLGWSSPPISHCITMLAAERVGLNRSLCAWYRPPSLCCDVHR